ncbi:MAG TPA: Ldh family oxidoreductase [Micromonospora sp.]|nr:Ldh family oxidoreductase [Micromonospora sp.]
MTTSTAPGTVAAGDHLATDPALRVGYAELVDFTTRVFTAYGLPQERAAVAAEALCHGDLTEVTSHGLTNLTRLYLPLFTDGRVDPGADLKVLADRGAAALVDGSQALGLWAASEAVDMAADRAAEYGVGVISVRNSTHLGCAGYHAARAVRRGMIGLVVSNCGRQRIIRPPGGRAAMLGTNPLSLAAPAGGHPPFVLDMSTTVVPTGRIRMAARAGELIPEGWLEDIDGKPVTDPGALDRGEGYLQWLGGGPQTGAYKGYGLGLLVEVLSALVPSAGLGPEPAALAGDGRPSGRDDDIGFLALVLAPASLRSREDFVADAETLFGTLLACPPLRPEEPVRYPGWHESQRAERNKMEGVPMSATLYAELCAVAAELDLAALEAKGDRP